MVELDTFAEESQSIWVATELARGITENLKSIAGGHGDTAGRERSVAQVDLWLRELGAHLGYVVTKSEFSR